MPDELQAAFAAALCDPDLPPPAPVRSSGKRRFDVYRNNRAVALIDVLADIFPVVQRLVGEAFFRAAARIFIDTEPPRDPVLLIYGAGFGDFLDDFEPATTVPYLGDVARLEWARRNAYHGPDAHSVTIDVLADFPADRLGQAQLTLLPTLHLFRSRFPVGSIWAGVEGIDMTGGEDVAVLRPDMRVETTVLTSGAYGFLSALQDGAPLGAAAQAAAEDSAEFDLAANLQGVFALGAVIGITDRC